MSNLNAIKKWDVNARLYDLQTAGAERRWAPVKRDLFASMGDGNILFLAAGTGKDFQHFPTGKNIVAIDISPKMLEKAALQAVRYTGRLELRQMDAQRLEFPSETFDQVFTSCAMCSVPDPVGTLKELNRVLKPSGELRMFEHTGSKHFPFRQILNLMNLLSERIGPSMNRDTAANVQAAGFVIQRIVNVYLDVVKVIVATKQFEDEDSFLDAEGATRPGDCCK